MARRRGPDLSALWTCPKCGAKLVTRNMAHSCGRATLADWKARMGPLAKARYERFESLIAACGPYHVAPAKTRIAFMALVRFAGITKLTEDEMICSFALPAPLTSPRFVKVEQVVPGWWVHRLRIDDLAELDGQVQRWLCRSYRVMGLRQHLRRKVSARQSARHERASRHR
ncbi:MAG: hypothetical protein ACT4QD_08025 [Acidobacteriota bacterium]